MLSNPGRGLVLLGLVVALLTVLVGCGSRPAALVNGQKITENDLNKRLRLTAGKTALAQMIETKIIRDAFAKAGLTISEEEVKQALTERFGTMQAFQQAAAQQGVNPDQFVEDTVKPNLMLEKLATKDLKYTEADVKEFYEKNKGHYNVAEKVTVRQIAVPDKATAAKVMAALQGGADFKAVVRQYATDPGARENEGLVPDIDPATVRPELKKVLDSLKEGQYAPPLQVGTDWLIVKLEKRQPAETRTYDQVQSEVKRDYLRSKLDQQTIAALQDKLHQEAHVQIVSPEFQSLNDQFQSAKLPQFGKSGGPAGQPGQPANPATLPAAPSAPPPAAPPGGE
jgi:foldase protein PrsA